MDSINVNLDNLTQSEREQLMKLVEKGSKSEGEVWKPVNNEEYWVISTSSGVVDFTWKDDETDSFCYSIGNCYPTKEDAEFAIEKQKVLTELQRYADEHNDKIDWDNNRENKYYIVYNHEPEKIEFYFNQYLQSNVTYFSNETIAYDAIHTIGKARIKKYLFNVEDKF